MKKNDDDLVSGRSMSHVIPPMVSTTPPPLGDTQEEEEEDDFGDFAAADYPFPIEGDTESPEHAPKIKQPWSGDNNNTPLPRVNGESARGATGSHEGTDEELEEELRVTTTQRATSSVPDNTSQDSVVSATTDSGLCSASEEASPLPPVVDSEISVQSSGETIVRTSNVDSSSPSSLPLAGVCDSTVPTQSITSCDLLPTQSDDFGDFENAFSLVADSDSGSAKVDSVNSPHVSSIPERREVRVPSPDSSDGLQTSWLGATVMQDTPESLVESSSVEREFSIAEDLVTCGPENTALHETCVDSSNTMQQSSTSDDLQNFGVEDTTLHEACVDSRNTVHHRPSTSDDLQNFGLEDSVLHEACVESSTSESQSIQERRSTEDLQNSWHSEAAQQDTSLHETRVDTSVPQLSPELPKESNSSDSTNIEQHSPDGFGDFESISKIDNDLPNQDCSKVEDFQDFNFRKNNTTQTKIESSEALSSSVTTTQGETQDDDDFGDFESVSAPCGVVPVKDEIEFDAFADFSSAPADEEEDWAFSEPASHVPAAEEDDFDDFECAVGPPAPSASAALHPSSVQPSGEQLSSLVSLLFPEETAETEAEGTAAPLATWLPAERGQGTPPSTWPALRDVQSSPALDYQWGVSAGHTGLLRALGIDSRNILFGQRWNVPRFAANLGQSPLEPLRADLGGVSALDPAPALCMGSEQETVPAAQFDWTGSGLVNPLDSTTAATLILDLDFLAAFDNFASPSASAAAAAAWRALTVSTPVAAAERKSPSAAAEPSAGLSTAARAVLDGLPDLSFMRDRALRQSKPLS